MGSVKLLKMQHHKELKRGRGSGGAPGSSPAPAGRAQHQQVGGGGPTRTVSGCRVPGALFYPGFGRYLSRFGSCQPWGWELCGDGVRDPSHSSAQCPHPLRGSCPHSSVPSVPILSLSPRQQCHGVNIMREPCVGTPWAAVSGPAGRAMLTGPCRAIAPANQFVGTPLTN